MSGIYHRLHPVVREEQTGSNYAYILHTDFFTHYHNTQIVLIDGRAVRLAPDFYMAPLYLSVNENLLRLLGRQYRDKISFVPWTGDVPTIKSVTLTAEVEDGERLSPGLCAELVAWLIKRAFPLNSGQQIRWAGHFVTVGNLDSWGVLTPASAVAWGD